MTECKEGVERLIREYVRVFFICHIWVPRYQAAAYSFTFDEPAQLEQERNCFDAIRIAECPLVEQAKREQLSR